jgi:peptidoglycan hydrolase CwlO-like protein
MKNKTAVALLGLSITILITACSASISYGLLQGKVSANEDNIEDLRNQFNIINNKLDKLTDYQTGMKEDLSYIKAKVEMLIEGMK